MVEMLVAEVLDISHRSWWRPKAELKDTQYLFTFVRW